MRKLLFAVLFSILVVLAAVSAPAFAMERSLQDDQTFVYNWSGDRDLRLDQFKAAGGDTIRINLLHVRGDEPLDPVWGTDAGGGPWGLSSNADMPAYDSAVDDIRAHGLNVQMTLVWYGQSDPSALAGWMNRIAAHFSGRVFRFSILNEPDLTLHDVDACDPATIRQMIAQGTLHTRRVRTTVYRRLSKKRLRHFKGKRYRRVVRRNSIGRAKVAYVRSRKGKYRRKRRWKKVAVAAVSMYEQDSVSVATGCLRIRQGLKYRQIVQTAAPAIKSAAPDAQVMAGETSPSAGILLFIDAATKGGLPVDGWLHHPYDGAEGGIYNGAAVAQAALMPVGYSEFGYWVDQPDKPAALRRAWQQARTDGAFEMNQYGFNTPQHSWWDTSLGGDANLLAYIMQ